MNRGYSRLKCVKHFMLSFPNLNNSFSRYKHITCFTKQFNCSKDKFKASYTYFTFRTVFSSNLKKSDGKSNEHSGESNKIPVDDEEFQNILNDFAKDFNVSGENEKILNDIKKSLDEHEVNGEIPSISESHISSNSKFGPHSAIDDKYKIFSEEDSVIIPSSEDIKTNAYSENEITYHIDQETDFHNSQVPVQRGITGVFDIDELVDILRKERMLDIAVISIPKDLHYADFLCLVTARSLRHSDAVSEYLLKLYKRKKHKKDPFIQFEGEKKANWKAIDMGNIVLHIFLEDTRTYYDIESLWLFDTKYDSGGTLKPDPLFDAIEEQMAFFNSLQDSTTKEGT